MANKYAVPLVIGGILLAGGVYLVTRSSAASILKRLFPDGFTASLAQLEILEEAGYDRDSKIYKEAIDIAYKEVAATCSGTVGWSSAQGYYCLG